MKAFSIIVLFSISCCTMQVCAQEERFRTLPFGRIKPGGWLKEQMQKDVDGFVGHLDEIVPELINDPIYGSGRLQRHSKARDLGNLKSGDAEGDEQYKWWNSETQSNWWDGYIRHVFLLDDQAGISKVKRYIDAILATQDEDGYIGIYDKDLRYRFDTENGELWSKATLYRGLLAYYECTNDERVFTAVQRAVENVMQHYPADASSPFSSGTSFNGGVSHGLTFTDVLERMFYHTSDAKYRRYALFLYRDFSKTYQSEADVQLPNILNPDYKLRAHGVHTYEHIRPLIVAKYASPQGELDEALHIYLQRIQHLITPSGGAIGDEWIAERSADATHTGYEYCSLQELLDSYCMLFQKTGDTPTGDAVETVFYNAAQGSRHPEHSCIAYLKTDNSFEMMGTKNGEVEHDRKQTRYKYSPAHQDVAVCCNPNAGRIAPYFVQNSWMLEGDTTLVATLLMPNVLETRIGAANIQVENATNYPYENSFQFNIRLDRPARIVFKIRKPGWVKNIRTNENFTLENGFIVVKRTFQTKDVLQISFDAEVQIHKDNHGQHYFTYGALLYARSIAASEIKGKAYAGRFYDLNYQALAPARYALVATQQPVYKNGVIQTRLLQLQTGQPEDVELIPFGKTILRQSTFDQH